MSMTIDRWPAAAGRVWGGVLSIILAGAVLPVHAFTTIAPGETNLLDVADDATCEEVSPPTGNFACVTSSPSPSCKVDAAARTLKVDAGRGLRCSAVSGSPSNPVTGRIRSASAIARLISTFEIEPPSSQPAAASLPVKISTEVSWDGILYPLAPFIFSLPVFSQVIATLQVRDTTTQEVVASNTFLFEKSGPISAKTPLVIESRIISSHSKQREDCFQKAVIKRGLRCMRRSAFRARSFSSP